MRRINETLVQYGDTIIAVAILLIAIGYAEFRIRQEIKGILSEVMTTKITWEGVPVAIDERFAKFDAKLDGLQKQFDKLKDMVEESKEYKPRKKAQ